MSISKKRHHALCIDSSVLGLDSVLRAKAKIARIGTLEYSDSVEYRSEATLQSSAQSFEGLPLVLNHPQGGYLREGDASSTPVGFVSDVKYVNGWLEAQITVTQPKAIQELIKSHRYFSIGYEAVVSEEKGVWVDTEGFLGVPGQNYHYDCVQTAIFGNHVALTDYPRAGYSATFCDSSKITINETSRIKTMIETKIGDLVLTLSETDSIHLIKAFESLATSVETLEAQNDCLKIEATKARVDSACLESTLNTQMVEKIKLWQQVSSHVDSVDYSMSIPDIKRSYLAKNHAGLADKLASASDTYIEIMFDMNPPKTPNQQVAELVQNVKADSAVSTIDAYKEAQQKYINLRLGVNNAN